MTRCDYLALYLQNTPAWPMGHVTNSLESYLSKCSDRKNLETPHFESKNKLLNKTIVKFPR